MNGAGRFVSNLLINHWATMITWMLGILVFAALSVPFLSYFGLDGISKQIFFALHMVCAQIPSHSFYIFGHQLGMCARNFSIYASMFIGSLIFVLSKKTYSRHPLVDLGINDFAVGLRWHNTNVRLA